MRASRARSPDKTAKVLVTTTANLAAAMKTENGIEIHIDGGTGIGRDPESIGRGIITTAEVSPKVELNFENIT